MSGLAPGASLSAPSCVPGSSLSLPARPFQRTVTMHKDSTGHVGFVIKKGKVVSVVRGSSAARNGLLTNHSVCEVNGQNVIGLKVGHTGPEGLGGCRVEGRLVSVGRLLPRLSLHFLILRLLRGFSETRKVEL